MNNVFSEFVVERLLQKVDRSLRTELSTLLRAHRFVREAAYVSEPVLWSLQVSERDVFAIMDGVSAKNRGVSPHFFSG